MRLGFEPAPGVAAERRRLSDTPSAADAACPDHPYTPIDVPSFEVTGELIAYASPDSTYSVTKHLFESAERSILIGIYDFTATYMRDLLLDARSRNVAVTVMVDKNSQAEVNLLGMLAAGGSMCVYAPSCQGGTVRAFRVCHEKVIVVDDVWTLVQSGNYSNASIPRNEGDGMVTGTFRSGNRDMGVAIRDGALARFFKDLLLGDIAIEQSDTTDAVAPPPVLPASAQLFTDAPVQPAQLFASFQVALDGTRVTPVLTPDNYLDVVPDFLGSATTSIEIEQQYIRGSRSPGSPQVRRLMEQIRAAKAANPALRVRIIVAPPFDERDVAQTREDLDGLVSFGFAEGSAVRLLSKRHFKHCHNKLVIVDRERVLVSSQNWSQPAVTINREAGLIIDNAQVADYFGSIFDSDWETADVSLSDATPTDIFVAERVAAGPTDEARPALIPIDLGDYDEV